MNLVDEITHNFKVQERHDREVKAQKVQAAMTQSALDAARSSTDAARKLDDAARELDDKARRFSRLQLAQLHCAAPEDKHALIERMCAENKARLQPSV